MEGGVPCEESGRENATCLADRCLWHKLGLSVARIPNSLPREGISRHDRDGKLERKIL